MFCRDHSSTLASVVTALALLLAAPASAADDSSIVARVNGAPIYRKALRELVESTKALQPALIQEADVSRLGLDALNSLVDLELLYQESQARKVVITDGAVDEEIERIRGRFGSPEAFAAAMKAGGVTDADLRRDTRKTMAVSRLLEGVVWRGIRVSDEKVRTFYEANHDEFRHPPQIRASHILIRVPRGAAVDVRGKAKDRIIALLYELRDGADFADLAKRHSDDRGSAAYGGDLGYFARGDMVPEFERTAFALSPGETSGVFSTKYGFHIVKVTDQRPAGYKSLKESTPQIRALLTNTAREKKRAELIAQLREKATIEITGEAVR